MKKLSLILLLACSVVGSSAFAGGGKDKDKDKGKKTEKCEKGTKCTDKSCCKKPSKAVMLKAKPVKAKAKSSK